MVRLYINVKIKGVYWWDPWHTIYSSTMDPSWVIWFHWPFLQEPNYWRYRFHICLAYLLGLNFREYTQKIWPTIWDSSSILGSWNSHWLLLSYLRESTSYWWFEPLWKIWKSVGMMTFPIYGKCAKPPTRHPLISYFGVPFWVPGFWLIAIWCFFGDNMGSLLG